MNAYELAKYLEDDFQIQEAVIDMLREQADRIAELEKQGEPVAWIRSGDDQLSLVKEKDDGYMVWKPLYLAPQTKPLSDEEIEEIAKQHLAAYAQFIGAGEVCYEGEIDFARAIEERHGIK